MTMTVNFRGGETTGGVSDRQIETAKQETTGGVGIRQRQNSIFVTEEPKCDTVCFRGQEYAYYGEPKKKTSATGIIIGTAAAAALVIGLLGLTHKNNWLSKIDSPKLKDWLKNSDKVTEPCYKACKWLKNNSYDKVVNFIKSKK